MKNLQIYLKEYSAPQTSPSHNNYQQDRQSHPQENYDDSYSKPMTYRDNTPSRQQKDASITPSMSTQSMREFNQEEQRNHQNTANNSHRSQNDLREMQDSYYGHSRTNLSQQPPRYHDERREFYQNRNASASREDFGEDVSESRRDLRARDGKVPWQFSDYMRRPTNRSSNLLSAVLCLVKELDHSSLEVVEHAVRCRIDELSDSL
jgi:cilla- and flagella-associated protein